MDLALNNLQKLISPPNPTNQPIDHNGYFLSQHCEKYTGKGNNSYDIKRKMGSTRGVVAKGARLRDRSKRVRTPVERLRLLLE